MTLLEVWKNKKSVTGLHPSAFLINDVALWTPHIDQGLEVGLGEKYKGNGFMRMDESIIREWTN